MNKNGTPVSLILCAAVVVLAVLFTIEHRHRLDGERTNRVLYSQWLAQKELIAENERLSNRLAQETASSTAADNDLDELLRLRREVTALHQETNDLDQARNQNHQARAALDRFRNTAGSAQAPATDDYWPHHSWAFKGFATPDNALQSSLWAADNADLKAFVDSTTGELRQTIEHDINGKTENAALVRAMEEVMGIQSIRVLDRAVRGDDTVLITTEFETRTGLHTNQLLMKRSLDGWKLSGHGP